MTKNVVLPLAGALVLVWVTLLKWEEGDRYEKLEERERRMGMFSQR
jgi:hypothetical protein